MSYATLIVDAPATNIVDIDQPITINNNQTSVTSTSAPSTVLFQTVVDQATYVTNFIDQYVGVNAFVPTLVDTNVQGEWIINLTTNNPVAIYHQVGNITSVVFSVDDTNNIVLGQILLLATTNSLDWGTNITWAAGSFPTPVDGEYNRIYFEAWRDSIFGVYVGSNP